MQGEGHVLADEPKTDREWLTRIANDVSAIKQKIEGKDGICDTLKMQGHAIVEVQKQSLATEIALGILAKTSESFGPRITRLENWLWVGTGIMLCLQFVICALVLLGRFIDFHIILP